MDPPVTLASHNAYVLSQPFPVSLRPGFQAVCPTCGVLDHDSREEDALGVAEVHRLEWLVRLTEVRLMPSPEPPDLDDLRRRQRAIEEALA